MKKLFFTIVFLSGLIAFSQTADPQLYETGLSKMEAKEYLVAIQDFSKIIATDPTNSNALSQRGAANYAIKNYKEAVNDYTKILEINPNIEAANWIYNYRGLAYSALQEHDKAVADYKKAFDEVFTSDDMAFKAAWPDLNQMTIIRESFKKAGALVKLKPTNPIIGKWTGSDPMFRNAFIEFKDDGSFYYSYQGHKSYEVVYAAHDSYMIMLDSASVASGHLVVKIVDEKTIEMKELWSSELSDLQFTLQFQKFKESTLIPGSKKTIDEAIALLGMEAKNIYSFRGQDILEKNNFVILRDNSSGIWDRTIEQIEIHKTIDSLKAIKQLKKISERALKAASYLSKIDPFEGYIPVSFLLLEHKRYNDAAFLFKLGMALEGYYEKVNPNSFSANSGNREDAYYSIGSDFESSINQFLEADVENNLFVLHNVYDYFNKNSYTPEPKQQHIEEFNSQLEEMQGQINYWNERASEGGQNRITEDSYLEDVEDDENLITPVASSIVGKWTGKRPQDPASITQASFDAEGKCIFAYGDNPIFQTLMQTDYSLYQKLSDQKDFSATYKINFDKNPIQISVELNIPDTREVISLAYIAQFFEKDVLKLGAAYLNNPTKFIPEHTLILNRETKGSKNYFDYKSKYPVFANQKSAEIPNKELEQFWNSYILPIVKKDTAKIAKNALFPMEISGNYYDSAWFNRESEFSGRRWDETSTVLQDLSYEYIDQVTLESGDRALLLYVLGKPEYSTYPGAPSYPSFGFLFIKSDSEWKLNNFYFSSSNGKLESIENERSYLMKNGTEQIQQRLLLLETNSIIQQNIEPIIAMNQDEVLKTVAFPLEGNWGNALGYINDASEWKKSDFSDNLGVFFNEETGRKLKEQILYSQKAEYQKVREVRVNDVTVKMNGEEYESSLTFKYTKINTDWKLTQLDWEGTSKADIKEELEQKNRKLNSEEFDLFMETNLVPIINLDKEKIVAQATFPFGYGEQPLSEKEFTSQLTVIFPQELRDNLKNLESKQILFEYELGDKRNINGVFKRDPPRLTALIVYLISSDFRAALIFKETNGKWVLIDARMI